MWGGKSQSQSVCAVLEGKMQNRVVSSLRVTVFASRMVIRSTFSVTEKHLTPHVGQTQHQQPSLAQFLPEIQRRLIVHPSKCSISSSVCKLSVISCCSLYFLIYTNSFWEDEDTQEWHCGSLNGVVSSQQEGPCCCVDCVFLVLQFPLTVQENEFRSIRSCKLSLSVSMRVNGVSVSCDGPTTCSGSIPCLCPISA